MALRTVQRGKSPEYQHYRRKADQAWDLAGCSRRDGDSAGEKEWTEKAREYEHLAAEYAAKEE